jgi:excinuclease ABC subunit C
VRRRYSRVLLTIAENASPARTEVRSADREDLDLSPNYSQENAFDTARRLEQENSPQSEVRNPQFIPVRLPDLIIVDGGKGQLSSACRELQRLGLHDLPIIGLAKEHEEIYRPGRAMPLQLPPDSGALHLLQRIRDEAHRFANAYHQLLLKKRIDESILDDCPGVSQNRKNLLLRKFGSVNRLRKASVEQIAATEGIGPKLAEDVHRFLQRH